MELPPFDRKTAVALLAEKEPELWRRCYPRVYVEPSSCGKYYSPKEVSVQMMSTAIRVRNEGLGGMSQIAELVWASRMASLSVPIFWVGHDLAEAIQQTVPPMTFDWVQENLPLDAMAFMIPRGVLRHDDPKEGDAIFVAFARSRIGDSISSLSPDGPRIFNILENDFTCVACTNGEALMHWTFARKDKLTRLNLAELDSLVHDEIVPQHTSYSKWSEDLNPVDMKFMVRVAHFIFGTIILMLAKPDLVTPASLRDRIPTKRNREAKEFWNPNVIGLDYRITREWQGGTHNSPRWHWVRGAYKQQPYGEQKLLRKRIWVEPYVRGIGDPEFIVA